MVCYSRSVYRVACALTYLSLPAAPQVQVGQEGARWQAAERHADVAVQE